jgi:hypothetical protein
VVVYSLKCRACTFLVESFPRVHSDAVRKKERWWAELDLCKQE